MQSVWRCFFAHRLPAHEFADGGELLELLRRMSRDKVREANRHYLDTQEQDLRRACSLKDLSSEEREGLLDTGPSPEEIARVKEMLEQFIASLPSRHVGVVVMLFDGYSHREIAEELGCTERTVGRVVSYLQGIF
jgi:DNA-directed RNA polymerase specialized sigma24 family protein